jgi:hypothetical protein
MKWLKPACVLALALCAASCSAVHSERPVGDEVLAAAPEEWNGTWLHKDGAIQVKVVDGPNGVMRVAWPEDKGGEFKLESYTLQLRKSGAWTFVNLREEGEGERYLWGRFRKDGAQVIVWTPDAEKFKALVRSGALPGKVSKDGDVVLRPLLARHTKLLTSEQRGVLFDWTQPLVFFRAVE